ncbi:MAG: DUF2490 domain-containing protein [Sphingobium sp.]|nr:DUF2490 domain-containing protein [Sphingobium sp.]
MKKSILLLAVASVFGMSSAANAAVEDEQLWLNGSVTVDLGNGFKISDEIVARFSDAQKGLYEIENNLLLNYKINKTVTIAAGYTHDPLYSGGHFTRMEHRAREQVSFDNIAKIASGQISTRARMEQRWRDGMTGTGWRFRPYVKWTLPIANKGKTTLNIWHESFINLNKTPGQTVSGYDRMRNNITVKFPISKVVSIEAGYLNQYQFTRNAPNKMDHVATATLGVAF